MSSSGYVEAANGCASNGSGYRAMGATRESRSSDGIFGAWGLECKGSGDGVDNSVSPGRMATTTTMADNVRRLLPKEHRFGSIWTTASGSYSSIPTVKSYSLTNRRQSKRLARSKAG